MFTKPFKELTKDDAAIAGGKGASLGEMIQSGIPVPDGYVVLADTFDRFLAETDLTQEIQAILSKVDTNAIHTVEAASEQIQGLIKSVEMPTDIADEVQQEFKKLGAEYVAVRSSATAEDGADHAWAGQLSSYLNTKEENLLQKVQECWASLFTSRAIFYRFEKELHDTHISVAVVVQKMVNSEKSGIAFSVHPVTEDYNQIIIEAGFGLGEAIVSGAVTPDSYVITKEPQKIIDTNINEQTRAMYRSETVDEEGFNKWVDLSTAEANAQVLEDQQIIELSNVINTIEQHYGFPCDIEWAFEGGKFYITQSRPITTLKNINVVNVDSNDIEDKKTKKLTYTKTIERDTTLLMEGTFIKVMEEDLKNTLAINPFEGPAYFFETNQKNVVFYENLDFQQKLIAEIAKYSIDDEFLNKVESIYKKSMPETLAFLEKGKAETIEEYKEYLEICRPYMLVVGVAFYGGLVENLPKRAEELYMLIRTENDFFATADDYTRNTIEAMGVRRDLINIISQTELNNLPSNEMLEERRKYGSALMQQDFRSYKQGQTILDVFPEYNFLVAKVEPGTDEIQGQSVSGSGKITGTVRIVKNKDDAYVVEEHEVIVASMTTPDFLPGMKKAKAFITDEGGITCHAAIISREMNKLCIIGTKVATQVLKDGDEVEVDADNGVVRIVSRKVSTTVTDYELTFEGQGMPYIYEVMLYKYYLPAESISVIENGVVREYMNNKMLSEMNEIGLALTPSKVKGMIDTMNAAVEKSNKEIKSIVSQPLTAQSVKVALANAGDVTKSYYVFDPHFFDGIFMQAAQGGEGRKVVQLVQEYKNVARDYFNQVHFDNGDIPKLLHALSKQISVSFEDLQYYDDEELIASLDGARISDKVLASRKKLYILKREDDSYIELLDDQAETFYADFYKSTPEPAGELRGMVAHAPEALVRGVVRCITRDYNDIESMHRQMEVMQKGEILVTQTTDPEMMPALRKAAAAVTDIGGMLSHTAITARELNIPCIVDTKFATQILKDGDEVEVDADNGVVRILKSSHVFEELAHLPIPLALVELHYQQESASNLPWTEDEFTYHPYIAYNKKDDQVYFYYNPKGIEWQKNQAGKYQHENFAIENIKDGYDQIKEILEEEKKLNRQELLSFVKKVKELWPWMNYMWWAIEYREEHNQDFDNLMAVRKSTEHFITGLMAVFRKSIASIHPEISEYSDLVLLSEIENEKISSIEILSARKDSYSYTNNTLYSSWDELQKDFKISIQEEAKPQDGHLKGQIASSGIVKGKVRIISKREEIKDFKKGEILVASTTTPDYLPAIKLAGAIVSEHGGMICHASIISRELKIPCVVGVSGATQVLKDGDEIEVDADNGVVSILSQNSFDDEILHIKKVIEDNSLEKYLDFNSIPIIYF